jgi:hypothetical protein
MQRRTRASAWPERGSAGVGDHRGDEAVEPVTPRRVLPI